MEIKTQDELDRVIGENDVVIVRAHAEWCSPCRVLGKTIAEIEKENNNSTKFVEVDVEDADEDFVTSLGVRNIPVLFYYRDGELVDKTVGLLTKDQLLDKINEIKNK